MGFAPENESTILAFYLKSGFTNLLLMQPVQPETECLHNRNWNWIA
jgi:hypothetical protein